MVLSLSAKRRSGRPTLRRQALGQVRAWGLPRVWTAVLLGLALAFAAPAAQANPDIWVKSKIVYRLQNESVVGLALEWRFDRYFSSRTIDTVDADGDGVFSESEAARLRQEIFDPLSENHYHLHVLSDGAPRDFSVATFEPGIENERLLFRFAVEFGPPVPYTREALVVSQFDERIVFDFSFMEQNFLLVEGPLAPGCKFRIGRGEGPLKGHDKTIALICEDQS